MLDKEDLNERYRTENGIIRSPGKYEGEPLYVPYFWEKYVLNGFSSETLHDGINTYDVIEISNEDKEKFDIEYNYIVLYESNHGFVYHELFTEDELQEKRNELTT